MISVVRRFRFRALFLACVATLLTVMVTVRIVDPAGIELLRNQTFDRFQDLRPREPSAPVALVVDVDEASLKREGQWPWPRTQLAELLVQVFNDGAAGVGVDMLLAEQDRTSIPRVLKDNPRLADIVGDKADMFRDSDEVLASIMKQVPITLGVGYSSRPSSDDEPLNVPPLATLGSPALPHLPDARGILGPRKIFADAATNLGNFMPTPGRDGVVRRVPIGIRHGSKTVPWLSVSTLMAATGEDTLLARSTEAGIEEFLLGGTAIPTDGQGRLWLRFRDFDEGRYISASDVLDGHFEDGTFANKIVYFGSSATGLGDLHDFPVGRNLPGVEMHLQVTENILYGDFLKRPATALPVELISLCVSILVTAGSVAFLGATLTLPILVGHLTLLAGGSFWAFQEYSLLLDPTFSGLGTLLTYTILVSVSFIHTENQRSFVKRAFSHYLSPELVNELVKDPSQLKLGGEKKDVTILFCDIRGFTSISESLKDRPEYLTALVNILFDELTGVVRDHGGTIDKYLGDALMAFWNAPLDTPRHRQKAIRAALEMNDRMAAINDRISGYFATEAIADIPYMRFGIGIATGTTVVGNMGSAHRFNYSVIGDAVNLASRIEGLTSIYSLQNLISEFSAEDAEDVATLIEVDKVQVKGKREPVRLYSAVGSGELRDDPVFQDYQGHHQEMLAAFRSKRWDDAEAAAMSCLAFDFASSELYAFYLDRIAAMKTTAPSSDWDGTFLSVAK